ncbi:hypothetical protein ACQY0O_005809 [Thecaphora frezii]
MPPSYSSYRHGLNLAGPSHRSFSHDIYIPASYEEQQRRGIESQLARSGNIATSNHDRDRRVYSASSSTMDTYDRIGRDDERFFSDSKPMHDDVDEDESLIPGVGRGLRAQHPSAPTPPYRRQQHKFDSQQAKSVASTKNPYSSRLAASPHHNNSPSPRIQLQAAQRPRPARVETASDSADETASSSASSSGDDGFESTGNHRAFAATPAGGTLTSYSTRDHLHKRFARPTLGDDTFDKVDFDRYTDSDRASKTSKKKLNEDDPTYTNAYASSNVRSDSDKVQPAGQQRRPAARPSPSQDLRDPFRSPHDGPALGTGPRKDADATRPAMSNAAAYQQHLNSRTLTSPAIRTLVGDRTKSPDSPSPAPSISGRIFTRERSVSAGRGVPQAINGVSKPKPGIFGKAGLEREPSLTAASTFEDMARKLQRDVELTRRADEMDDVRRLDDDAATAINSNSGGSGFGPGSQVSSARTRVETNGTDIAANMSQESGYKRQGEAPIITKFNANGYPSFGPEVASLAEPTMTTAYPAHLRPGAPGHLYPGSAVRKGRLDAQDPFAARLPDLTGLTSALASPLKARDGVSHVAIDPAVGSQFARLEELGHLRAFVDSLQTELDRAGERIFNLEESQELQKEEVDGLRREVENVWKDVKEVRGEHFIKVLMERIREEERQIFSEQERQRSQRQQQQHEQQQQQQQQQQDRLLQAASEPPAQHAATNPLNEGAADETSHTHVDPEQAERPRPASPRREARMEKESRMMSQDEHDEVVHRLYGELDKLKMAMEEQFRKATQLANVEKLESVKAGHPSGRTETTPADQNCKPRPRLSSGSGADEGDYRDPWDAIEALRTQVVYLASEVEKLNDVVVEELIEPRKAVRHETIATSSIRKQSASSRARNVCAMHDNGLETDPEGTETRPRIARTLKNRSEGTIYPASDPAPYDATTERASTRRISTPPLPRDSPTSKTQPMPQPQVQHQPQAQQQQRSRVAFGSEQAGRGDDPDETIDAAAENRRRRSRNLSNERAAPSDDEEEDVSIIAEARAQRAFESMARHSSRFAPHPVNADRSACVQEGAANSVAGDLAYHVLEHNTHHCTVCCNTRKSARRHASRRIKALERERLREVHEAEEEALLEKFDHDVPIQVSSSQMKTLQKMLQEHWDEFVHQRMLYSELADELKHMSPRMGKEKRRILAQHVLDAVETLELKADRINRLEKLIESMLATAASSATAVTAAAASELVPDDRVPGRTHKEVQQDRDDNGLRSALDRISMPTLGGVQANKTRLTPKAQKKALERLERLAAHPVHQGRNSPPTINLDP